MSLVGSLEDLGLGDILQIISLSRKSGVLFLRSDEGEGRIVLRNGQVHGAVIKSGPNDLRSLLITSGVLSDAEFEQVAREARARGVGVDQVLAQRPDLGPERLEVLRRAAAENAVLQMFRWQAGEFGFEARDDAEARGDAALLLETGLSAQFLAMEGTRLNDEARHARLSDEAGHARSMGEAAAAPGGGDVLAGIDGDEPEPQQGDARHLLASAAAAAGGSEIAAAPRVEAPPPPAPQSPAPPLVVIDRELAALEWARSALRGAFSRIHVFQRSEIGIARVRQYLRRAETPLVLLSTNAPADPLTGARDAGEIVARLKAQSPRMSVVLWVEPGQAPAPRACAADARVERPGRRELVDRRAAKELAARAPELERALLAALERGSPEGATGRPSCARVAQDRGRAGGRETP